MEPQLKIQEAGFESRLKAARFEVAAAGAAETTKNAVEAAVAKGKVEMFTFVLVGKAEDAAKAATLQQGHTSAQERYVERSREDQARRNLLSENAERQ